MENVRGRLQGGLREATGVRFLARYHEQTHAAFVSSRTPRQELGVRQSYRRGDGNQSSAQAGTAPPYLVVSTMSKAPSMSSVPPIQKE